MNPNTKDFEERPNYGDPVEALKKDKTLTIADVVAPQDIEVNFDYLRIGKVYFRTLFVAGYPRFVVPGWLEPVVNFDHSLDISFYIYPVEGRTVLDDLRRKITEMEAEMSTDIQRGRIVNPGTEAKLEDAKVLQEQLVKGIERFYQYSFYITIPAASEEELNNVTKRIESTLGSVLIVSKHATLDHQKGFLSSAPFGRDVLTITRNMDTTSLATTFPFTTAELSSDTGILYGINAQNDSFIIFDRFSLENSNLTVFATSGAGKSLTYNDNVLYDVGDGPCMGKIGSIVEQILSENLSLKLDLEAEGVLKPKLKVFTFTKELKGSWANVEIAARKVSPKLLYKILTRSGRETTITKDHNLVVLKNGLIDVVRGDSVKAGDHIPIPRKVQIDSTSVYKKDKLLVSPEFLVLLGFITSEGSVNENGVRVYNTDVSVLKIIMDCIQACGYESWPIYKKITGNKTLIGYAVKPRKDFARFIKEIGASGNSGTKRVAPYVFALNNEQVSQYLKAYFEGDGGTENHEITATTKSKELASDLSYLLLRFGIIVRIKERQKAATNTKAKIKRVYYRISISGQANIQKFVKEIGFITDRKNQRALHLLKTENTNVDVIPEIGNIFKEIYPILYNTEIPAPKHFSEIKLGIFEPSPQELLRVIANIEKRVEEIEALETDGLSTLQTLPSLDAILDKGHNKKTNTALWTKLGKSWHTMKHGTPPQLANTLLAISVTHEYEYTTEYIGGAIYRSFKNTGESLLSYDKSLWERVVLENGNTSYKKVLAARDFIVRKYEQKKEQMKKVKSQISWLKTLARADLFWDPIVKIKKIRAKHPYVYDLQVENAVFLAGHGGMFVHNSFFVKLESLRSLMMGAEIIVIDPENEYRAITEAVGGEYIAFSFSSPSKINPFDLSQIYEKGENQLGLKILTLHSLFKVIMGALNASQEALLDRALINAYKAKGITMDPDTQDKEPPLIEDLYKALIGMETTEAIDLASRIEKYVKGSYVGIFDQQTNINISNPFTTFSVRDIQDTLRPIAMFIILDFIWTKVRRDIKKRLLVVDEAWHMMRYEDTAAFLWSIVKRARKYYLGLTTITQDVEDFLSQDIGKAVVTNSAMRLLLKQSPAAIDRITETFYLSQGEKQLLLAAGVGEGILFAGPHHAPIRVVASPEEYEFVTTKPQDLMDIKNRDTFTAPQSENAANVAGIVGQMK